MARSFLIDGGTGSLGLVWGLLVVAATFSVIAMAVFVCGDNKESSEGKETDRKGGMTGLAMASGGISNPPC